MDTGYLFIFICTVVADLLFLSFYEIIFPTLSVSGKVLSRQNTIMSSLEKTYLLYILFVLGAGMLIAICQFFINNYARKEKKA